MQEKKEQRAARPEEIMTAPVAPLASAVARNAEAWFSAQSEVLATVGNLTSNWIHRRHEALDAARDAVRRACECRDPTEMMRIHQEWLSGEMDRIAADFAAVNNSVATIARNATSELEQAARNAGESGRAEGKEMLKAVAAEKPSGRTMT